MFQIRIEDSELLVGSSIAKLLKRILDIFPYETIKAIRTDADYFPLAEVASQSLELFLKKIEEVPQIVWATFVFMEVALDLSEYEESNTLEILDLVNSGACIVRCVDGCSYYIYTLRNDLIAGLKIMYSDVEIRDVDLTTVEWPN